MVVRLRCFAEFTLSHVEGLSMTFGAALRDSEPHKYFRIGANCGLTVRDHRAKVARKPLIAISVVPSASWTHNWGQMRSHSMQPSCTPVGYCVPDCMQRPNLELVPLPIAIVKPGLSTIATGIDSKVEIDLHRCVCDKICRKDGNRS